MNTVKIIGALVIGFLVGGLVNMSLVMLGPIVVPPPEGVDMTDPASLQSSIHLLRGKHFVFPFLAHALGTLSGALVAYVLAPKRRKLLAWVIGVLTLCGGIAASAMIPAPIAFIALDLSIAYLPMAWLATRIGGAMRGPEPV